ncbi:hypothetical protein [Carboxylicivirga marina]|uniref:hypothetical protein n=1 Tax=Carboxylicivirga marina TaxID=2800988 RepID=UPI0025929B77|nr:hypothetical protein [uncultured Carboxylicivirga sp.]
MQKVASTKDYVAQMIRRNEIDTDEFHNTEITTDKIADELSIFLADRNTNAFSQSEANIEQSGLYNTNEHRTPLPHKTIALLAGMGWIGKNDLLITPHYGSAISMCSVLTDTPLDTTNKTSPQPTCGTCSICQDNCKTGAIKGHTWTKLSNRDMLINVHQCKPCLQCMVTCPHTVKYFNKK